MINIHVTDADGAKNELTATPGSQLMNTIRDAGIVEGTCGGMASCGTCHVYIDDDWNARSQNGTDRVGYGAYMNYYRFLVANQKTNICRHSGVSMCPGGTHCM